MFKPVTSEPVPYVLEADRQNDPSTRFWMTPQTADQTQAYLSRYARTAQRGSQDDAARAARLTKYDREHVLSILSRVENAYEAGDDLTEPEDLARVVGDLDYRALQELSTAAQSMSVLKESEKNF